MKVFAAVAALIGSAQGFVSPSPAMATNSIKMFGQEDLKKLAVEQNPAIGYFDPLNLAEAEFWDQSNEATIGFLRHAEMKHGRVAMMGFVGYCVHANGITWPWKMTFAGDNFPTGLNSAGDAWDAIPAAARYQIIGVIAFLEFWGESRYILESDGTSHYMRGGKPGYYPTFKELPHPVPFNLYDPFGLNKKKTDEQKARGLNIEVNNGRLAMIGLFGFLAESKVPGSVPFLKGLIPAYSGNYMVPFEADFSILN